VHDVATGLVFMFVSCVSFTLHSTAMVKLARDRAQSPTEKIASAGYVRTVACRVAAAATYIVVASLQLAGVANLTETTLVFTCVQGLWLANSLGDIRARARIAAADSAGHPEEPA
jgi:hypothetical protein